MHGEALNELGGMRAESGQHDSGLAAGGGQPGPHLQRGSAPAAAAAPPRGQPAPRRYALCGLRGASWPGRSSLRMCRLPGEGSLVTAAGPLARGRDPLPPPTLAGEPQSLSSYLPAYLGRLSIVAEFFKYVSLLHKE